MGRPPNPRSWACWKVVGNSMTRRRGRTIATSAGILGLAVLAGAGFASRDRIVEQYWLWRPDLGDENARELAARRLGEMRSARGVSGLLKWLASSKKGPGEGGIAFSIDHSPPRPE